MNDERKYPEYWSDLRTGEWLTPDEWQANADRYDRERRLALVRGAAAILRRGADPLRGIAYDEEFGWKSVGIEEPDGWEYKRLANDIAAILDSADLEKVLQ